MTAHKNWNIEWIVYEGVSVNNLFCYHVSGLTVFASELIFQNGSHECLGEGADGDNNLKPIKAETIRVALREMEGLNGRQVR